MANQHPPQQPDELIGYGEWHVCSSEYTPGYINMSFDEVSMDGASSFSVEMPADIAINFANSVIANAEEILG